MLSLPKNGDDKDGLEVYMVSSRDGGYIGWCGFVSQGIEDAVVKVGLNGRREKEAGES